ncbi:MAG TPA: response regulator [Thermoanaerobaculia bacterium]|nr:response regulator [Thermoanaerobaculia bacterium]
MRRALIVDDEGPIRNLLAAVLRRERIPADTAANGSEAIELLTKGDYACVVLDLMMPVMNGRDVIDAMLRHRTPRVPVIVVTAAGEAATGDLEPEVVKVIIRKPFDVARVVEAVRAFCAEEVDGTLDAEWTVDSSQLPM